MYVVYCIICHFCNLHDREYIAATRYVHLNGGGVQIQEVVQPAAEAAINPAEEDIEDLLPPIEDEEKEDLLPAQQDFPPVLVREGLRQLKRKSAQSQKAGDGAGGSGSILNPIREGAGDEDGNIAIIYDPRND
jgi:hypothetical protein